MSGTFQTVNRPTGVLTYEITNRIGEDYFLAPLISNQTSYSLLMEVNSGLASQSRCNCSISAGVSNVTLGYYRLSSGSSVRGYFDGNYTGRYYYYADIAGSVETKTGALRLTFR